MRFVLQTLYWLTHSFKRWCPWKIFFQPSTLDDIFHTYMRLAAPHNPGATPREINLTAPCMINVVRTLTINPSVLSTIPFVEGLKKAIISLWFLIESWLSVLVVVVANNQLGELEVFLYLQTLKAYRYAECNMHTANLLFESAGSHC